ncbi:MAG: helix-turn-helix domain-containing protein [Microthrixaceae bacterium]
MLRELAAGERSVGELAAPFEMSLAAASKHVKALEAAGLVRREIRGRTHLCRLDPGPLSDAHAWLGFYERFWTTRLDALERLLRDPPADATRRPSPRPARRRPPISTRTQEPDAPFGRYVEPTTLTIVRRLPGPAERVWRHLTDPTLRRQWLADGAMTPRRARRSSWCGATTRSRRRPPSSPRASAPSRARPAASSSSTRRAGCASSGPASATSRSSSSRRAKEGGRAADRRAPAGLPDRDTAIGVGAGWHAHLDILAARMRGATPPSFWAHWRALREDYADRAPG